MIFFRWHVIVLVLMILLTSGCSPAAEETAVPDTAVAEPTLEPPATTDDANPPSETGTGMSFVRHVEGVPLARVNGEEITWQDYEPSLREALRTVAQQSTVDWSDAAMQQRLGTLQNDVLVQTVDRWLLRQMAAEQGIAISPADWQAEMQRQKSSILEGSSNTDWDTYLQGRGFTEPGYEQVVRDTLLLLKLLEVQQVDSQADQVHIAHIVVGDESTAEKAVAELEAGRDFSEVAAGYSEDGETADAAGDLGWFSQELMLPELAQAAFSLQPGQWAGPIRSRFGYTFILLLEREARDADPRVLAQRQQEALKAQLDRVRAEAQIEYLVDFATEAE
ncbi:peptidylprolyl isomerase [Chloroflexota bacterium]